MNNIILNSDSYKYSMHLQYPSGTETVFSYIESRGGEWDQTVFFGLQAFIKEYLTKPVTMEQVDEAKAIIEAHGEPFNYDGWKYIVEQHQGWLPIKISALPEGTVIPTKNVLATIENTDPKCFWLTTFLETALLRAIWYPTTVATQSYHIRQLILKFLEDTGDSNLIDFKLHDFGARGVSSFESAGIGAASHLVNFLGTDTITGLMFVRRYYGADIAGYSIPAMEHSTVTSWGRENEGSAYSNMLNHYAKTGKILACVSDSYDIYNAVDHIWGEELKDKVIRSGATVVIRPDSGDPATVVVNVVRKLWDKFGGLFNDKGFRVLHPSVRVIQGDGINYASINSILFTLKLAGFSADNVAFGMGGALLQGINRDTLKFAMKCSAIKVNGEWRDVYKDPVTDSGKTSKKGLLKLVRNKNTFVTINHHDISYDSVADELRTVYLNGKLVVDDNFEDIRRRARE